MSYGISKRNLDAGLEFKENGGGERVRYLHATKGWREVRIAPPVPKRPNLAQKFYAAARAGAPAVVTRIKWSRTKTDRYTI